MKRRTALFLTLAMAAALLAGCGGSPRTDENPAAEPESGGEETAESVTLTGTQKVVMEGFDWGPGVTKTILALSAQVDAASVSPELFAVDETKEAFDYAAYGAWAGGDESADPSVHTAVTAPRTVLDAYVCDPDGSRADGVSSGSAVALELACTPEEGDPYCFDLLTWHNTVPNPYELYVTLTEAGALRTADGAPVSAIEVEPSVDLNIRYGGTGEAMLANLLSQFILQPRDGKDLREYVDLNGVFTGTDGRTLRYASYEPENAGMPLPLVIWLHGAGEGGEDPSILILGNKVTALYGGPFQTAMGGAYVLTPQTPDFWLTYNDAGDWEDNPGVTSVYNATLMELIEAYVAAHPGVDVNRIYIGGCSNGGYMTMDMILTHPDYFAAAYPICEAYADSGITDEQLAGIKDVPVWFVWAENDGTVDPSTHEVPTVERLRAIGADVHTSVFPNVADTSGLYAGEDGAPYEYMGHWSWLYFFNGECEEDGVNLWDWMAAQSR